MMEDHGSQNPAIEPTPDPPPLRLHRLGRVRQQRKLSREDVARALRVPVSEVERQEQETSDVSLSELYQWQRLLQVPLSELLVESRNPLSLPPVRQAQMSSLAGTAVKILDESKQTPIRRMAQTLINQIVELMPEVEQLLPKQREQYEGDGPSTGR
jgi:transcriptional regulator with XRE-family HTH domain